MDAKRQHSPLVMVAFLTIAGLGLFACATEVDESDARGAIGVRGGMDREPLVVYDVSGYGIGGLIHRHLAVYTSGMACLSSVDVGGSSVVLHEVTAERALQLNDELIVLGALEMADRPGNTADLPMTTITIFNGGRAGAVSNNFNFYAIGGSDDYQAVVNAIDSFINETFAGSE